MIGRLSALFKRHAEFDLQLRQENSRPAPDSLKLATLKKQKLATKDAINARLRRRRRYRNQDLEYPGLGV